MENIPYIPELPNSTWATQEQCVAELESLRAWKAEIEKQEPVAFVDPRIISRMQVPQLSRVSFQAHLQATKVYADSVPLFAAPVISPNVERLKAELDGYKEAGYGDVLGMSGIHEKLRAENQSLKAELVKATRELEAARKVTLTLRDALYMAVCQNEHDMLMTGEELRACNSAIEQSKGA